MTARAEKAVAYFYDQEIGNFCYGGGNPMRPHRARLVYSLLKSYGLTQNMILHKPEPRSFEQLTEFHADDYIDFLRVVTPSTAEDNMNQLRRFNMGQIGDVDCPVFDGVYEYCQRYAGGSVEGAAMLADGSADIAFNWSGGMHHAKRAEASGFCYVNDIVLAILELLKEFQRVLYVDIDIHHGDGVEEAFCLTDRVMTVSFHKYGEFFPGTGALDDVGFDKGKNYTVNVPLKEGMDDNQYKFLFEPIMTKVIEMYQPGAVVMCCGADSLSGDKLGCFNLSMEGHSACIEFMSKYNLPLMVLGGGGYTLRNVARCWCYETGRLLNVDLPDKLPESSLNEYNYYLDTGSLRISVSNMKNLNTLAELVDIRTRVLEHLSHLPAAPSVGMCRVPKKHIKAELPEEDSDVRGGGQAYDDKRRVMKGAESDDEEEGPGQRQEVECKAEEKPPVEVGVLPAAGAPADLTLVAASLASSEALNGGRAETQDPQVDVKSSPTGPQAEAKSSPEEVEGVQGPGTTSTVLGSSSTPQAPKESSAAAGEGGASTQQAGIGMLGPSSGAGQATAPPPAPGQGTGSQGDAGTGGRTSMIGASLDASGGAGGASAPGASGAGGAAPGDRSIYGGQ